MGRQCVKNNNFNGDHQDDHDDLDRKKKDIKLITHKKREADDGGRAKQVVIDIAVSDVDRDIASSQKPSLAGMHRGSSFAAYQPQGTIVSSTDLSIKGSTAIPENDEDKFHQDIIDNQ